ncbi:MAG: DUF2339 domain-containing protein [Acidobacteriota bacterium]
MSDTEKELRELKALVAGLTRRIFRLEQAAGLHAPPAPEPGAVHTESPPTGRVGGHVHPPDSTLSVSPSASESQPFPRAKTRPAQPGTSDLETQIGSHWLNRIGIAAVLVGASFFLKHAFENNWIGPAGRVAIGLLAGTGIVVWSERFRSRGYSLFSHSLKGVGVGILYLSLWAAFHLYQIIPGSVAFLAMLLITAATAVLALRQNTEVLAVLALVGGFVTPVLLSTGQNKQVELFCYVLLLDIATLVFVALRGWVRLLALSYAGTFLLYVGWYDQYYDPSQLGVTFAFATLFFGVFAVAALLVSRSRNNLNADSTREGAPVVVLVTAVNAVVYFLEVYGLLNRDHYALLPWIALAIAAAYLLLSRQLKTSTSDRNRLLVYWLHVALAFGFVTIAIPLKLETHWITIGWLVESALLLWISRRAQSIWLKNMAAGAFVLGVGRLLLIDNFNPEWLVFNARMATFGIAIAILAAIIALQKSATDHTAGPSRVVLLCSVAINLLALHALNQEVSAFFTQEREVISSDVISSNVISSNVARDFSYSALWMIYGAALMAVGFWKRSPVLRWQALILIAITTIKVFLYDVSQLSRGYRASSFVALGVVLLAISFVYQRNWLKLSGEDRQ